MGNFRLLAHTDTNLVKKTENGKNIYVLKLYAVPDNFEIANRLIIEGVDFSANTATVTNRTTDLSFVYDPEDPMVLETGITYSVTITRNDGTAQNSFTTEITPDGKSACVISKPFLMSPLTESDVANAEGVSSSSYIQFDGTIDIINGNYENLYKSYDIEPGVPVVINSSRKITLKEATIFIQNGDDYLTNPVIVEGSNDGETFEDIAVLDCSKSVFRQTDHGWELHSDKLVLKLDNTESYFTYRFIFDSWTTVRMKATNKQRNIIPVLEIQMTEAYWADEE